MKKFLSIWMLMFLLWGLALPAAAEETCTKTEGCTLADGHDGLCNALCSNTEGCTQFGGHTGECTVPCKRTGGCTKADGHEGLCDALCTNTEGCTQYGGHEGECTLPCTITKNCTKANGHEGLCDALCSKTAGCILFGGHEGECQSLTSASVLNSLLSDKEALIAYQLRLNPSYAGGDIILQLPATEYGEELICGVVLDNGSTLTLKGAENKNTNIKSGLTVNVPNLYLDGIKFSGTASVIVNPDCNLAVSNCAFKGSDYAFRLKQDSDGKVALLTLTNNSFDSIKMAAILDSEGITEVGWWRAEQGGDSSSVEIDFGVTVKEYKASNKIETLNINVFSPKAALISKEWGISFLTNCSFNDAYVVYGNKKAASSLDTGKKQITIGGQYKGEYIVVNDSYPKLVEQKGYYELPITANHKKYLDEVTLDFFPYAAANVTLYGKTVDTSIKIANGTRSLTIPKIKEGTYVIKETIKTVTTTKAVTKTTTKTTSRSYKYTYQDYYLVTPAGFANGMRYVKDNLVTLDCTQAAKKPISLPVASMAEAAEKGYSVLVKTKDAELTLDAAALKSLAQQAKGTTVLLHYKSLNHKTLTTVGQTSVQSHLSQFPGDSADLAFLVTATSDSETIEDLQKGTITLKIPFIVLPSTEGMENRVYALQSSSLAEARETAVADGFLTTKLLDLTEHMVFQVGEPVETTEETMEATVETTPETTQPETEPETTAPTEPVETAKKSGGLIIGLSVVLVILCGALGFLFLRKRFQK